MSFGLIWFSTKPKQMAFSLKALRPKQIGPNEIWPFGTKTKQMAFGNRSVRPKQIGPNENKWHLYMTL